MRALVAEAAGKGVLEQVELGATADEGRARPECPRRAGDFVHEPPGTKRSLDALQLERACIFDHQAPGGEPVGRRPDEDLARRRSLLQARREVDGFTGRERRVGALDDELAGLDPDARAKPELVDGLSHGQCRTRRSVRVVLVCLGNAKRGHHGVAGELLDDAPVDLDAVRNGLEELVHAPTHDFGIRRGHEPGRVDEVDEQHRCKLALHR